jgi:hypothetical protein
MATPGNGVTFQWRDTYGVVPNFVNVTGLQAPVWVQLVRAGDVFSAYYSTDAITWTQLGSTYTVVMNSTALVGLAVTAHNNGVLNTATFDNLSLVAPVDLSGAFNQAGMFTDGTSFAGGLDGNGDAYSATLLGSAMSANGYNFNLGPADNANAVQATGQTIGLPPGRFSGLSFLGTGVNGPQPGQTFVVNYTDGSSDTFTQDLSDWLNPQGYAGEAIAAALSYYTNSDGSSSAVTNYLYQYSFALSNQKTVSSILLPDNGNVMILAIDLGVSYSASSPAPAPSPHGHDFNLGAADSAEVVLAAAQNASRPAEQFTVPIVLGTRVDGRQPMHTFAVNSSESLSQEISDWLSSTAYGGQLSLVVRDLGNIIVEE